MSGRDVAQSQHKCHVFSGRILWWPHNLHMKARCETTDSRFFLIIDLIHCRPVESSVSDHRCHWEHQHSMHEAHQVQTFMVRPTERLVTWLVCHLLVMWADGHTVVTWVSNVKQAVFKVVFDAWCQLPVRMKVYLECQWVCCLYSQVWSHHWAPQRLWPAASQPCAAPQRTGAPGTPPSILDLVRTKGVTGERCGAVRTRLNQWFGVMMSFAQELKSISPS